MPSKPLALPVVLRDGNIYVNDQLLALDNVTVMQEIGRGANAVVFTAVETILNRFIALKVWTRAFDETQLLRAQVEITKLAGFSHPLFLTVHRFSHSDGIAHAMLELVTGQNVTQWLRAAPPLADRCAVWCMFATALHHAYQRGIFHGDPHTGNIFVFEDEDGIRRRLLPAWLRLESNIAIKVADLGSSLLWPSSKDFARRESRTLIETANRLFPELAVANVLELSADEHPKVVLSVLDRLAMYASASIPGKKAGEKVALVADAVYQAPFFNLDRVLADIKTRDVAHVRHTFRRIAVHLGFDSEKFYEYGPFVGYREAVLPSVVARYGSAKRQARVRTTFLTETPLFSKEKPD